MITSFLHIFYDCSLLAGDHTLYVEAFKLHIHFTYENVLVVHVLNKVSAGDVVGRTCYSCSRECDVFGFEIRSQC